MRKIPFFLLVAVFFPLGALAAGFETDLYFGLGNNSDVRALQEFLRGEDLYAGPVTGNFLSLTKEAVISFQKREGIEPSAGYFGPKTRARINEILVSKQALGGFVISPSVSREEAIALISAKISELTARLLILRAELSQESSSTSTVLVSVSETPPAAETTITPVSAELRVSTLKTYPFPEVETNPLELGEFKVKNTLSQDVLLTHFDALLSDGMDSPHNRNRKVYFILRDGLNPTDAEISKIEFTFVLTPPEVGSPHISTIKFPFNALLKSGGEKTVSLWTERLEYVRSGTLKIKSTKTGTTDSSVVPVGGFDFVFTKEPPL